MARPRKTLARPRRVKAIPKDQIQPGAVGATLSRTNDDGLMTGDEASDEQASESDGQAESRRTFLALMRRRFRMSADAESQLRTDMAEDMRFYNSEQWPDHILTNRILDERVTLTINRLPQFVRQVVNQARQSKPAIQVNPVDNGADPETAEVFQGICRQIERQSKATVAYSTASEHQAIMGRGWWRVLAEYARDDSMEQEIRIKRIADAMTVYPDPACVELDNSDATFCFIVTRLNKTVYDAQYGSEDHPTISAHDFQSIGDDAPTWLNGDGVQLAEYFYIEHTKYTLAEVLFTATPPGVMPVRISVDKASLKPDQLRPTPGNPTPAVIVLKSRPSVRKQVKWCLTNGIDILDGNADKTGGRDLPGSYIPVVPVIGEELIVNGRRNIRGMVRDAQSPQRAYNYWLSAITEKLALSTKAPIIAAVGQLEGLETKWNNSNKRNYPYLEYRAMDVSGQLVPPPQRASYDPDISAALQMTMQADRDLKSVVGMFDASQERSPEQSGKAILARQQQGEQGTSHFLDNLARAIEHTGRILIEWIPVYYDTPRMLRINGLDEQPQDIFVHAGQKPAATQMQQQIQQRAAQMAQQIPPALVSASDQRLIDVIKSGRVYDLGVGRYDVTISVGPSYQSRRQESVEAIISLVQANPNLMPWVVDILMENMDWPGARQLAVRLKRMLPPQARDPEEGGPEIPPEVQQQLQALQMQLQQAMQALQEKDSIINTKAQELASKGQIAQMEIGSKERIESLRIHANALHSMNEINAKKSLALLEAKLQEIGQRLDQAHELDLRAMGPDLSKHPAEKIDYRDAPPDIRRQMERQAGMVPSSTTDEESPLAKQQPPPPKSGGKKPGGAAAPAQGAE